MRPFRPQPSRSRGIGLLAAGLLAGGLTPACSDADTASEAVADGRARIEAEFGPRGGAARPVAAVETPVERSEPRVEPSGDAREAAPSEEVVEDSTPAQDATRPAGEPPGETEERGPVDVDSLLALANSAYASLDRLRAAFSQRIENPLLGRTREGRGSWHQAGRNRFRMDFDEPADDIYVADGSCLWLYEPSLHDQVMVSALEQGVEIGTIDILGRLLSEARTRYDGVDDGVEDIDGVETRVVSLTPRQLPARYVEVRLWIGVSDRYVRRFRIREENQTLRTVTLTRLEPQAPIDPSVFDYAPPAGVPVFPDDVQCD